MKKLINILKILAFVLIVGAVYFSYVHKSNFELVISGFIFLFAVFALEYFLPYLVDYKNIRKRHKFSKEKTHQIYVEKAELEVLKKDVNELKEITSTLVNAIQQISNSLESIKDKNLKYNGEKEDVFSFIKDPVLRQLAIKSENEKKNLFATSLNALDYLRKSGEILNITVEELADCIFRKKDCLLADAILFAKEYLIFPKEFLKVVEKFHKENKGLKFKDEILKNLVIVSKDCVYVNFALFRNVYQGLLEDDEKSKDLEPYFAIIFKDYLCSSINWRDGFIKKMFTVKEKNKKSKRPLIAFKREFFSDLEPKKDIEVLDG